MADKTLIEANRRMLAAKQVPAYKTAQEAIGGRDNVYAATVATNRARKNKITAINNSVSNSMGKMKSDLDLTAYTAEEQKNIRSFLVTQRNKYANAANELARIEDASSPEYQFYVDIMNDVNNSFTNLKGQLDSYKANKVEFAEGVKNGVFSQGNDDSQYAMAATMYGLVDGEKANAPFQIGENGALGFDMGGEFVSYNDFEQPFVKDYKAASGILKQSADLYKNHQTLSGPQKDLLRINLNASLQDPKTIKSLVSDFADEGLDLSDIPLDNMDAARDMIVDRVMNSYTDVAARGKTDYDARKKANNSTSTDSDNTTTDNTISAVQAQMKQEMESGNYARIDVSSNVQLVWSPPAQAYVKKVRGSAASPWKTQVNADGKPVTYVDPSFYK